MQFLLYIFQQILAEYVFSISLFMNEFVQFLLHNTGHKLLNYKCGEFISTHNNIVFNNLKI